MKLFAKSRIDTTSQSKFDKLPNHIGIIMDGNGRWAKKRGLPRSFGHRAGAKTFRKIVKYCSHIGVKYLTVFAFSTENWKRPKDEIDELMKLFEEYLREALDDFENENIKTHFLGDSSAFSPTIRQLMDKTEIASKDKTGMLLNIAMNYGSRAEIVNAVKLIAQAVVDSSVDVNNVDETLFSNFLYTKGQPDVDLVIRSSGEFRLSNFLLWQASYAEYFVSDVLWPDFSPKDIDDAICAYSKRARRFGGVL